MKATTHKLPTQAITFPHTVDSSLNLHLNICISTSVSKHPRTGWGTQTFLSKEACPFVPPPSFNLLQGLFSIASPEYSKCDREKCLPLKGAKVIAGDAHSSGVLWWFGHETHWSDHSFCPNFILHDICRAWLAHFVSSFLLPCFISFFVWTQQLWEDIYHPYLAPPRRRHQEELSKAYNMKQYIRKFTLLQIVCW